MNRSQVSGSKWLVTTDHEPSTLAGFKILKRGGNAVDAAVASAVALTVVDPYMAGLGGYGYALYYSKSEDKVYALDFIGTAPRAATIDMFTREKAWEDYKPSAEGPLSILVPGSVAGWNALLERFGTLKFKDVIEPAIALAKRGFRVTPRISEYYESLKKNAGRFPSTVKIFYKDGHFPRSGELLVQNDLARTLETLAERGASDYYNGEIAKKIVSYVQAEGGVLSEEDLSSYQARWVDPLVSSYRGAKIYTQPPGSSGMTILQWLNILENFQFDGKAWNSAETIHNFFEAGKLALRDDDMWNTGKTYAKIPVERLTSKEYAKKQSSFIDPNHARFYDLVSPARELSETTTHFCTFDSGKNILTMTQTQMYGFDRVGIYGDLGFNLNDGMCYFSMDPNNIERMEPGQRPRYVMSPTIAFTDDGRIAALGAAGGWTIPQTITEVLFKILEYKMQAQEAVSSPRYLLRYRVNSIPYAPGTVVDLEKGIPRGTDAALKELGHAVYEPTTLEKQGFGALHAIVYDDNKKKIYGGTESRRRGSVKAL